MPETETHGVQDDAMKRAGYGEAIGFGERPAFIAVDISRAFTTKPYKFACPFDSQIEANNRIIRAARPKGVPLFFTTVWYDDPNLKDAGIWGLKLKGAQELRAGSPAVEIDPRLEFRPDKGDALLMKKYASSFFGTDLFSRLASQQIDTVIITGISTSGCVRATAVDAIQYGFRPVVVADGVADRWPPAHEQALYDMHAKYADVMPAERVVEYLNRLPNRLANAAE